VVGDYDGDGKSDIAIFRPGDGSWWINRSTAGLFSTAFGTGTDKAVPGDYTGDGKTDIAVWRPSTGFWYFLRSEDLSYFSFPWGGTGDIPASGDYDGDGKWDASVFRPSDATWYINRSTGTPLITAFGANGDRPIPNSFVP
jgi:VCBS repeat protein